jgi:hypothetical protein
LYSYNSKRDIESFSAFARGEYLKANSTNVPGPHEGGVASDLIEKIGVVRNKHFYYYCF